LLSVDARQPSERLHVANWTDLINFVRNRYEILEQTDTWVRFDLPIKDGRTQQVSVHHVAGPDGHRWIDISSPVGWADKIDLRRLLELAGTSVVGGAAVVDGVALFQHAVPLDDLDVLDFEGPFRLVVQRADEFEHELTGDDRF
jgi:hypothetical protein